MKIKLEKVRNIAALKKLVEQFRLAALREYSNLVLSEVTKPTHDAKKNTYVFELQPQKPKISFTFKIDKGVYYLITAIGLNQRTIKSIISDFMPSSSSQTSQPQTNPLLTQSSELETGQARAYHPILQQEKPVETTESWEEKIKACLYYHGEISSSEADKRLWKIQYGSKKVPFLIRYSSNKQAYFISMVHPILKEIKHQLIKQEYFIDAVKNTALTIEEAINRMFQIESIKHHLGIIGPYTYKNGLKKSGLAPSTNPPQTAPSAQVTKSWSSEEQIPIAFVLSKLQDCPFFHGAISSDEAKAILQFARENSDYPYLIRYSIKQDACFIALIHPKTGEFMQRSFTKPYFNGDDEHGNYQADRTIEQAIFAFFHNNNTLDNLELMEYKGKYTYDTGILNPELRGEYKIPNL